MRDSQLRNDAVGDRLLEHASDKSLSVEVIAGIVSRPAKGANIEQRSITRLVRAANSEDDDGKNQHLFTRSTKNRRGHQVESQVVQKSSPEGYSDESNSTRILKSTALARGRRVASIAGIMVVNFMIVDE